jgi:hypothetical protein
MRVEHWIAAHPAGPADRSIFIAGAHVTVVARTSDGGVEARLIPRGEPMPEASAGNPEPVEPTRAVAVRPLGRARDWIVGDARVTVLTSGDAGVEVRSLMLGADPASDVVVAAPADAELLAACDPFVVAVGPTRAQAMRGGLAWPAVEIAPRAPLRGASRDEDAVHVACDDERVVVGALERDGTLVVHRCTVDGCEAARWPSGGVVAFDVAVHRGRAWALASGDAGAPQVRAAAFPFEEGAPVVGACWSGRTGLCGPARFASGGDRLLLVAREGADALVLTLGAQGFEGLRGLASSS